MSRSKVMLLVAIGTGSTVAMIAAVLYSYAGNTVWHFGSRMAFTPAVVLVPLIGLLDVIACIVILTRRS